MRLAETQAAPLARDVGCLVAVVGRTVTLEVVVVVVDQPGLVIAEVLVLRDAAPALADLVVLAAVRAVLVAERLATVDTLARRRRPAGAAREEVA